MFFLQSYSKFAILSLPSAINYSRCVLFTCQPGLGHLTSMKWNHVKTRIWIWCLAEPSQTYNLIAMWKLISMYLFELFQADGFPTLLFFPAGNKSFEPVTILMFLSFFLSFPSFISWHCCASLSLEICRSQWMQIEQWRRSTISLRSMHRSHSSSRGRHQSWKLRPLMDLLLLVRKVAVRMSKMNCKSFELLKHSNFVLQLVQREKSCNLRFWHNVSVICKSRLQITKNNGLSSYKAPLSRVES